MSVNEQKINPTKRAVDKLMRERNCVIKGKEVSSWIEDAGVFILATFQLAVRTRNAPPVTTVPVPTTRSRLILARFQFWRTWCHPVSESEQRPASKRGRWPRLRCLALINRECGEQPLVRIMTSPEGSTVAAKQR